MGSGGCEEVIDVFEGIGDVGREVSFEMGDDALHATGEEAESAADASDEKRIETVKSRKDFPRKITRAIGLFAEKDGVGFQAFEEDDPVTGKFRVKDGDEINRADPGGGLSVGPDADGVQFLGQAEIAFLLRGEIFHLLEGGDEFARADVARHVLDGVADGQHGLMIEEVGHIGDGQNDDFPAGRTLPRGGGKGAGLFELQVGLDAVAKQPFLIFFFRSPTNHMGRLKIGIGRR